MDGSTVNYGTIIARVYTIRIEKHLQCEKLLGLAGRNTKKHGNKKSGESRTPVRYNVIHMYIFAQCFSSVISRYFCFPRSHW